MPEAVPAGALVGKRDMARARRGRARLPVVTRWSAAVMALSGLVGPSWGAVLVPAAAHFHLSLLAAGSLFAVRGAAGVSGSLVAGSLSDRISRHALLGTYGGLLAAFLLTVALAPAWWVVLVGAAGIALAFGCISTETSAFTAVAGGEHRGRDLSFINATYGGGAAVGPLAVGAILAGHLSWRVPFAGWAVLALALLLPFSLVARSLPAAVIPRAPRNRGVAALWPVLRRDLLVLWGLSFTYNGVGWAIVGWSATWLVQRFGTSLLLGATSATVFYVFLTLGRFINAWLAGRVPGGRLLAGEALLTAAGLTASAVAHAPLAAMAAFALTGLAMGGIYPNVQAQAVALAPDRPGALTASVSIAGSVGTMTVPAVTGALGSSAAAMGSLLLWAGITAALGTLAPRVGRAPGATAVGQQPATG